VALSKRYGATTQQLGDIWKNIMNTQDMYGSILDRGMKMYQAGLQALESEISALERAWSRAMQKSRLQASQAQRARAETDKTVRAEAYSWANRLAADFASGEWQNYADTPEQAVEALAKRYPQYANKFWEVYNDYIQQQQQQPDTFGYSRWEVESGVAGQPKTEENINKAQQYIRGKGGKTDSDTFYIDVEMALAEIAAGQATKEEVVKALKEAYPDRADEIDSWFGE